MRLFEEEENVKSVGSFTQKVKKSIIKTNVQISSRQPTRLDTSIFYTNPDRKPMKQQEIKAQITHQRKQEEKKRPAKPVVPKQKKTGIQLSYFKEVADEILKKLSDGNPNEIPIDGIIPKQFVILLLLESHRRNCVEEIIQIITCLKHSNHIIQRIRSSESSQNLMSLLERNDLIDNDLAQIFAVSNLNKRVFGEDREIEIKEEKELKETLTFLISDSFSNQLQSDKLSKLLSSIPQFQSSVRDISNKSEQIISTFLAVFAMNLYGIQMKNTDLLAASPFKKEYHIISSNTHKGWLETVLEAKKSQQLLELKSSEKQFVFCLNSIVDTNTQNMNLKIVNVLSQDFLLDNTIWNESQLAIIREFQQKEAARVYSKELKSIQEYLDENQKIKLYFKDGLELDSYLVGDQFISIDVGPLPGGLSKFEIESIFSIKALSVIETIPPIELVSLPIEKKQRDEKPAVFEHRSGPRPQEIQQNNMEIENQSPPTDTKQINEEKKDADEIVEEDNESSTTVKKLEYRNDCTYQIRFSNKEEARQFYADLSSNSFKYEDKEITASPNFQTSLSSIRRNYKIAIQLIKTHEVEFVLSKLPPQFKTKFQEVRTSEVIEKIQNFLQHKMTGSGEIDISNLNFNTKEETFKVIDEIRSYDIENIFDVRVGYSSNVQDQLEIPLYLSDFWFKSDLVVNNTRINITSSVNKYNPKELSLNLSSQNEGDILKIKQIIQNMVKPIVSIPITCNKEKEAFFDSSLNIFKNKMRKNKHLVYFNTVNMCFEFYSQKQWNSGFFNSVYSEQFNGNTEEETYEKLKSNSQQFITELHKLMTSAVYYVHSSLQEEFLKYLVEKKSITHKINGQIVELKLSIGDYIKFNPEINLKFVRASYLARNKINSTNEACCAVCFDSDHLFSLSNCGCKQYCRDCLREKIITERNSVFETNKMSFTCYNCPNIPIALKDFAKLFNLYEIQNLMKFWVNYLTCHLINEKGQKLFAKCLYQNCQAVLEIDYQQLESNPEQSSINCLYCSHSICSRGLLEGLKLNSHTSHPSTETCIEAIKKDKEAISVGLKSAKYCPTCSQVYFHEGGCNHLTCYQCGENFCSLCNKGYGKDAQLAIAHTQVCQSNSLTAEEVNEMTQQLIEQVAVLQEEIEVLQEARWDDQ